MHERNFEFSSESWQAPMHLCVSVLAYARHVRVRAADAVTRRGRQEEERRRRAFIEGWKAGELNVLYYFSAYVVRPVPALRNQRARPRWELAALAALAARPADPSLAGELL